MENADAYGTSTQACAFKNMTIIHMVFKQKFKSVKLSNTTYKNISNKKCYIYILTLCLP
jgi:hypothetical protein